MKCDTKTLVVFFTGSMNIGNIIFKGRIKTEQDITLAKKEIEKEYGHKTHDTIILNLKELEK